MRTKTHSPRLFKTAITLAALAACDAEPSAVADAFEVEFRDDYKVSGDKLNTNFLDEIHPLNDLPTSPNASSDVQIQEIRSGHCLDTSNDLVFGSFSTSSVGVSVPVSSNGVLGTILVSDTSNPGFTCRVEGELWEDTYWEIVSEHDGQTVVTDLWLHDVEVDPHGNTAYEWYVNYLRIHPDAGRPEYRPTCDEDVDGSAIDETLKFHSYLIPGLEISSSADFTLDPNPTTMAVMCRSGAVGKSIAWGYSPWTFGVDTHELATRMVRADYCGTGESFTVSGTQIWVESVLGPDANPPDSTDYDYEAVWDAALGRASCVDVPRLGGGPGFNCAPEDAIPACIDDDFDLPGTQSLLFTYTPIAE